MVKERKRVYILIDASDDFNNGHIIKTFSTMKKAREARDKQTGCMNPSYIVTEEIY